MVDEVRSHRLCETSAKRFNAEVASTMPCRPERDDRIDESGRGRADESNEHGYYTYSTPEPEHHRPEVASIVCIV